MLHTIDDIKIKLTAMKVKSMEIEKAIADKRPEEEIKKIYKFMAVPYYKHRFEDLKQVEVNGMKYDDTIVGKNMHTIRTVVRKVNNPYINKIPERIRKKYEHIRF